MTSLEGVCVTPEAASHLSPYLNGHLKRFEQYVLDMTIQLTFRTLFSGSLRVFEECPSSTLRLAIENHSRACR